MVGTPHANRDRPELQRLLGCFVNTVALRCARALLPAPVLSQDIDLPLFPHLSARICLESTVSKIDGSDRRTDVSGDPSFSTLLDRVKRGSMAAFAHAEAPFAKVVEAAKVPRSAAYTPIYQVTIGNSDPLVTRLQAANTAGLLRIFLAVAEWPSSNVVDSERIVSAQVLLVLEPDTGGSGGAGMTGLTMSGIGLQSGDGAAATDIVVNLTTRSGSGNTAGRR